MEATASAKYLRGSAQKARLVVDMIRGKDVNQALAILRFTKKRAATSIEKCMRSAIANANANLPTGTIYGEDKTFTVLANGKLLKAAGYGPTIIAYRNGNPVRLDEVAHVYDGVENDKTAAWYNGERAVFLAIQKQPGTNVVAVVDAIKQLMPTFRESLPPSVILDVRTDR